MIKQELFRNDRELGPEQMCGQMKEQRREKRHGKRQGQTCRKEE
jgi:hypothetical protein